MDLPTLLAVEEATDFLAALVADGMEPTGGWPEGEEHVYARHAERVREYVRQELGMAVTDAMQGLIGLPQQRGV